MRRHADLLLAAVLLIAAQVELALSSDVESRGAYVALAALVTGAVALRRRVPMATMLVAATAYTAVSFFGLTIRTAAETIAFMILVFSVGEQLELRPALAALAAAGVGLLSEGLGREAIGDVLFVLIVFVVPPWLIGRAVRARNARVVELEQVGAALEAERARAADLAAEGERARIAREMHDVLSHSIGLITLQAGAGERLAVTDPQAARETLRTIAAAGRAALDELEDVIEEAATVPELAALADGVRAAGVEVDVRHEEAGAVPPDVVIASRRIVQEALTNVIKHAAAERVTVTVRESADSVDVLVEDDGTGAGSGGGTGRGLVGMRERATVYNGDLEAGPRPGGGFAVRARLRIDTRG